MLVEPNVKRERVGIRRALVNFHFMFEDSNAGWEVSIPSHDMYILQTDGEFEDLKSLAEAVHEMSGR